MKKQKKNAQHGFSVMEMLMVVFILSIVLGGLFKQLQKAQTRYLAEDQKLDLTQETREFIGLPGGWYGCEPGYAAGAGLGNHNQLRITDAAANHEGCPHHPDRSGQDQGPGSA